MRILYIVTVCLFAFAPHVASHCLPTTCCTVARLTGFPFSSVRNAAPAFLNPPGPFPNQPMKFYLTLLRHEGKRLPADRILQTDRLVTAHLSSNNGVRLLSAICCVGGGSVAQLWEPILSRIGIEDFTMRGIERVSDAGVVQEWRLRPHHADVWAGKGRAMWT